MKRQLCVTVFFALVLVPDWVSACWPPPGGSYTHYEPVYYYHAPAPVYYAPPVYCQPVYVYPCAPVAAQPLQPPRVEQSKPTKPSAALEPPKPLAQPNPAPRAPQIEPVRPAANTEAPKPMTADPEKPRPTLLPEPAKPEGPKITFPSLPDPKAPATEPKFPPLVLPGDKTDPKPPTLELPKDTGAKPPTLEVPKVDAPAKAPEVPGAPAVPVPAPAPDALIPPPGVSVPRGADSLPPLTLPPDTPINPDVKPTEAKSSPLTGAAKVSVFPASGTIAANGLRKIGFYNHTDRDLALTIEGKTVTLPAKTYLHAQMPRTFTWKHGDRPSVTETVPADAGGLDVLFNQ